jgi:hypothetical protein
MSFDEQLAYSRNDTTCFDVDVLLMATTRASSKNIEIHQITQQYYKLTKASRLRVSECRLLLIINIQHTYKLENAHGD